LFKKYGLEVTIQSLPNDTVAFQGLVAKTYDLVFSAVSTAIVATASGAPVKAIVSPSPYLAYWFVTKKGINSYKEMEGKSLGVSSPGSVSAIVPIAVMRRNGVDVSKVKVVQIGPDADRGKALIAGTIDGAVVNPFVTIELLKQPTLQSIADVGAEFKDDFFNAALFARPDAVADTSLKATFETFAEAIIDMNRQMWDNKQTFVAATESQTALPAGSGPAVFDLIHQSASPYYGVDGGLPRSSFDATVRQLITDGQIKAPISFETVVDKQFVDAAIKKVGAYKK
jgi:ABC-type nitrate/sulfonate/bicarbonate transport system substrate-binding protein